MEMIDILNKLREYQEAGHKIDDAISNVERTNPVTEATITSQQIEAFKKWHEKYSMMKTRDVFNYAEGIFRAHMETGNTELDGYSRQDPEGKAYDELNAIFPSMKAEVEEIGNALRAKGIDPYSGEKFSEGAQVTEAKFKPEVIAQLKAWAKKYDSYFGKNGDDLPSGWVKGHASTGITSDGYDDDEIEQWEKKFGKDENDWEAEEHEEFQKKSKITGGMIRDLGMIIGPDNVGNEEVLVKVGHQVLGMDFGVAGESKQTEGRVKDMVMDMEQDAAEMSREEFIKKHGKSYVDIYDRVQKEKSYEGKEMKKEKIDEAIQISTDSPQEASMMMQILKLAGVQPVDAKMIGAEEPAGDHEHSDDCGCDHKDEAYANEPEEKMQSVDDLVNTHSGGLNRQKQTFPKVAGGDNPMQKTTEELADNLRAQYNTFKENYAKAIEEAKAKSPYAIGMAQAMKSTGDKPPLEKSTIKKAHDIAKSIEKKS